MVVLHRVARGGLTDKVTFAQSPAGAEGGAVGTGAGRGAQRL